MVAIRGARAASGLVAFFAEILYCLLAENLVQWWPRLFFRLWVFGGQAHRFLYSRDLPIFHHLYET